MTIQQYLPTYAGNQELGAIVHHRNHVSRDNSLSKITQRLLHGSVASQATHDQSQRKSPMVLCNANYFTSTRAMLVPLSDGAMHVRASARNSVVLRNRTVKK